MNKNKLYISLAASLVSAVGFAQEQKKQEKPSIGTQEVTVVTGYEATVSDALKINEVPKEDPTILTQKREVDYKINSFPVASTFVPQKGEVASLEKGSVLKTFDNYVLGSFGNHMNINGEAFVSEKLNKFSYIAGMLRHNSSQGGVDNDLLDDNFSKTSLNVFYAGSVQDIGWSAQLGGSYQLSHWYGLPLDNVEITRAQTDDLKQGQRYKDIYLKSHVEFRKSPFKGADLYFDHFWDDYGSSENRFSIAPTVQTDIGYTSDLHLKVVFDYVDTKYKDYAGGQSSSTSNFNIGFEPSVKWDEDKFSVEVGAGLFYNGNQPLHGKNTSKFYFFPQVKANYQVVDNLLLAYAGIDGGLQQNSFKDFVEQNPFVAPELSIVPTNTKYDVFVGLQGQFDNNLSYNVKASYKKQSQRALFTHSMFSNNTDRLPWGYGNSFVVEYHSLKTLNLFAEVRYQYKEIAEFTLYSEFNKYKTDALKPWNLPEFRLGADVSVDVDSHWFGTMELFYVGKRYDSFNFSDPLGSTANPEVFHVVKKLDGYADLNLKVGYRFNKNWTFFVKGNNLLNDKYDKWGNFQVQGIQGLAGAIYKFDF